MASGAWIQCKPELVIALCAAVIAFAFPIPAMATEYSAQAIEARVVDTRSNTPVEGVIVVAHWQLEGGLEGGNVLGQVMVQETTTDTAGVFKFPAWGPVTVPKGLPSNARLKELDPELVLFKPGYKFVHLQNSRTLEQTRGKEPFVRTSDWNNKTIKMTQSSVDLDEMEREISGLDSFLSFATNRYSPCAWKSMPRMIEAAHKLSDDYSYRTKKYVGRSILEYLLANDESLARAGCGSPKQFFAQGKK